MSWPNEDVCDVCPAHVFGPGEFDVIERPSQGSEYHPAFGYRKDRATGVAVCVHPLKVGLPPGCYKSAGAPLPPDDLVMSPPDDAAALGLWLRQVIHGSDPVRLASTLREAEAAATEKFSPEQVIEALREALASAD